MPEPVLLIAATVLLGFALLALRRAIRVMRLVATIKGLRPTSIAEAEENGLQLVQGRIASASPILSAFQKRACVYYAYRVEEARPPPEKTKRLAVGKDWSSMELEDETGVATIESRPAYIKGPHEHITTLGRLEKIPPEHAEFFEAAGIHERHLARFQNVRVVEYTLEPGDEVHALGTVRVEEGRKIFYRATRSPLAVTQSADAGLVPGYRNELLLFSVASALLLTFTALFLVLSFA